MAIQLHLKKVFLLNEDIKYPKCYRCKKELSPYSITDSELKKLPKTTIENLIYDYILFLNFIQKDLHLLFVCKHCLKGTYFKINE